MAEEATNTATATEASAPAAVAAQDTSTAQAATRLDAALAAVRDDGKKPSDSAPVDGTQAPAKEVGDPKVADPAAGELRLTAFQRDALEQIGLTPEDVAKFGDKGKDVLKSLSKFKRNFDRVSSENGQLKAAAKAAEKVEPDPLDNLADDDPMTKAEVDAYIERKFAEKMAAQADTTPDQDANAADEFVKALDPDIYPMFGTGAMGDLDADSAEAEARNELFAKAQEFQADAKARGGALTLPRALDRAKRVLYPDEHDIEIEKRTLDTTAARRKGSGLPPTSKGGPIKALSAEQQAAQRLDDFLAKQRAAG